MSRLVRCTCRSYCLTFDPETQTYEGEGELVPHSTAANHRKDDLLSQTLDTFTENVATQVLSYSPPPELLNQHPPRPGFHDQNTPPGSHNQPPPDIYFALQAETVYRCTWTPVNHSLVFAVGPSPALRYQYPSTSEICTPNREPYALHPRNVANEAYLENESRLCEILMALERRSVSDIRDRLLARVYEGLAMMERHKETEWNRQRAGSIARHHGYSVVDTGT
jgi:hypothetical protein